MKLEIKKHTVVKTETAMDPTIKVGPALEGDAAAAAREAKASGSKLTV